MLYPSICTTSCNSGQSEGVEAPQWDGAPTPHFGGSRLWCSQGENSHVHSVLSSSAAEVTTTLTVVVAKVLSYPFDRKTEKIQFPESCDFNDTQTVDKYKLSLLQIIKYRRQKSSDLSDENVFKSVRFCTRVFDSVMNFRSENCMILNVGKLLLYP